MRLQCIFIGSWEAFRARAICQEKIAFWKTRQPRYNMIVLALICFIYNVAQAWFTKAYASYVLHPHHILVTSWFYCRPQNQCYNEVSVYMIKAVLN